MHGLSQHLARTVPKHLMVAMPQCTELKAVLCPCREKLGWLINSAAAVVFTIILIIVLCRYRYYYNSYNYVPY